MSLGGIYKTGKMSATNGSAEVEFVGALMTVQAEQGDWLYQNGYVGLVETVTDDLNIILSEEWPGPNSSEEDYTLVKMSWLRYDPAITQQKVRELILLLEQQGTFLFVEGDEPDPGIGEVGQWALKVNVPIWQLWYRSESGWELQGSPIGIAPKGIWSSSTTYGTNDVVSRLGNAYTSKVINNLNYPPESNPDKWDVLLEGGTRYDLAIWDNGKSISGEVLWHTPLTTTVQFPLNLLGSRGISGTPATNDATYSIRKNGVEFGTATFEAGESVAVFASTETTFEAGDVITVVAPTPQDDTLSSTSIVLTGYH